MVAAEIIGGRTQLRSEWRLMCEKAPSRGSPYVTTQSRYPFSGYYETCARLGVFGAFCALWLFIVAERRGGLAAVRLAVAIARICQAAARIREQRLIL